MPSNPFLSLFGRSPIGPMQQHMVKAHECASQLVPFIEAVVANDWTEAERLQLHISQLERDADKLKKDVRVHLPKSLFLPVPRSDLLELLSVQDKVANRAKDIAGLMLGRQMDVTDQAPRRAVQTGAGSASSQRDVSVSDHRVDRRCGGSGAARR